MQGRSALDATELAYARQVGDSVIKTSHNSLVGLVTLFEHRQALTDNLFQQILNDKDHKLGELLPATNTLSVNLRKKRTFQAPKFRTERFKKSFIVFNSLKV